MRSFHSQPETLAWAEYEGVDLSLLRERLRLTPTARLQRHQAAIALVDGLRHAKRKPGRAPNQVPAGRTLPS